VNHFKREASSECSCQAHITKFCSQDPALIMLKPYVNQYTMWYMLVW